MPRPPLFSPQRKTVFLATEGKSETGYGRWLGNLAREHGIAATIQIEEMKGGDAIGVVNKALKKLAHIERSRGAYDIRAALLDRDPREERASFVARAEALARREGIHLIWQVPSHEAFLLRHFPGQQRQLQHDAKEAKSRLGAVWPRRYEKGMSGREYGQVLTTDHLTRARKAEPQLDAFLRKIGWSTEIPLRGKPSP